MSWALLRLWQPLRVSAEPCRAGAAAAQEVGVHVLAPTEVLAADPLPGAVAQVALREAAGAGPAGPALPQGTERFAVVVDGTESEEELASLQVAHLAPPSLEWAHALPRTAWRRPESGALMRSTDTSVDATDECMQYPEPNLCT